MGCGKSSVQCHPSYDRIVIKAVADFNKIAVTDTLSQCNKLKGKHIFVLKSTSNSISMFSSITNRSGHSVYICFLEEDARYHKTCLYNYEIIDSKFIKIPSGEKFIFGRWQFSHFQEGEYEATCEKSYDDNFVIYKGHPKSENKQ